MPYRIPISSERIASLQQGIKSFVTVFDLLDDQIIITDENANIIYVNPAAEKQTGLAQEEIIGKTPGDLWGGNMTREFYENMWKTIKVEKRTFVGEVKNRRKDGETYWCEVRIFPILNPAGGIDLFVGLEPNITLRKNNETVEEKKYASSEEMVKFMANQEVTVIDLKNRVRELEARLRGGEK